MLRKLMENGRLFLRMANNLAKSQNGTVLVHASKGKNKGKFIK